MLILTAFAAFAAVTLTGCAGLAADVHTANPAAALQGERTYAITRMPSQDDSGNDSGGANPPQYEVLLREALATKAGFVDALKQNAHYLLSVAYDTRLAAIGVDTNHCGDNASCSRPAEPSFSLFGGPAYRHSLTLRFFERTTGHEVYKVSATSSDRDADPQHALPMLVKSALAKFPFDPPADWRVKLRVDQTSGVPDVVSVKPLEP